MMRAILSAPLACLLSGCAMFAPATAPRPVPPSEVMRLLALPDAHDAAVAAPIFTRDALETVSRLQAALDKQP